MKKYILSGLALVLTILFSISLHAYTATEGKKVDIMFLHDTHSHLNAFTTVEGDETKTVGGFSRIKTLINKQLKENKDTLLLDAGDFSMGTLVQVLYETQASELRMLGSLGIVATTFGNHEFDYGADGIANMMNAAMASGDTLPAMLMSNIDWEKMNADGFTEDQRLLYDVFEQYAVKDYIVVEKNGVKIALMGIFGKDALACVVDCPIIFKDPVEAAKETVEKIKASESVDMIVCLSHSGTSSKESKSEDEILAKAVPDIDVIVSGHTHTQLDEAIVHGDTYIVSCAEYGKYLGSMSLTQKDNGRWALDNYELLAVTEDIAADKATQKKVNTFFSGVNKTYLAQYGYKKDQVLCTNEVEFVEQNAVGSLHTELNLGSIMADAYTYAVEHAIDFDGAPVDVAVVPAGTIRDTYPLGNITVENVFNSFSLGIGEDNIPGYPLISVYLTGKELKLVAEIDASISDLMTTARLYTDGLHWAYNPNRLLLNKVTDVYISTGAGERAELIDDKLYRVVTDFYSSQMLGGVTDMSYGLLSIVPKDKNGQPLEDYKDAVITVNGQELKAWVAIAQYMESFSDTDGDGIGNVPQSYSLEEGRKVVENDKSLGAWLKNPNQFFYMIMGVAFVVVIIVVFIFVFIGKKIVRLVKRVRK